MFSKTGRFLDEVYGFKDYESMALRLDELICKFQPLTESFLEVACGTGQFLRKLKQKYRVEGLDINSEALEVAATHCPEVPFHRADMVDFAIPRRFDVIACLFSSIAYVQTVARMTRAVERMAAHLNRDGVLLLEPYFSPETCWDHDLRLNVHDGKDRKVAWMYVSEVKGKLAVFDVHYLVGERTGVQHFIERHELGLFTDAEYREALKRAGLTVSYDPAGVYGRGMYIGSANGS
jgi:SAM-dependent methyltransferase